MLQGQQKPVTFAIKEGASDKQHEIPSGKLLHINGQIFNSYVTNYRRVAWIYSGRIQAALETNFQVKDSTCGHIEVAGGRFV